MRAWLMLVLTLSVLFPISPSSASTATTTFDVSATVSDACTVTATNLDFGTYNPLSVTDLESTSTISVRCTLHTDYHVRLNQGLYGNGVLDRQMQLFASTERLGYELYRDAGRTQNWGESDGVDTVDEFGTGLPVVHTVYGRVSAEQNVPPGSYHDTITVTVKF